MKQKNHSIFLWNIIVSHLTNPIWLTRDSSPEVQLAAFLAQAVLGEPVNQENLKLLVGSLDKTESLSYQLISYERQRTLRRKSPATARLLGALLPEEFESWARESGFEDGNEDTTQERLPPSLTEMADTFVVSKKPEQRTDYPAAAPPAQEQTGAGEPPDRPGAEASVPVKLVVFFKPGCSECRKLGEWLENLTEKEKTIRVEHWNINTPEGLKINRILCDRFSVDARDRGVAPAVFSAVGARVRTQLTRQSLHDLIDMARTRQPDQSWADVSRWQEVRAEQNIRKDFDKITLGVVLANGLADGINPCAFAALIFLLSYLAVARKPVQAVMAVGLSYTIAVFLTYLCVGLGFTRVAEQLEGHPWGRNAVHVLLVSALVVLIVLNLRDAYVCYRQGAAKMTLRLPAFLTRLVHGRIRRGMRARYIVPAAFVTGMIVSLLELACTGQVYLPTILFVLRKSSAANVPALAWLILYNLAFILPLLVVFVLYACGLRSQTLTRWFDRHAVLAKLLLSLIFMLMLALLILT